MPLATLRLGCGGDVGMSAEMTSRDLLLLIGRLVGDAGNLLANAMVCQEYER